MLSHLYLPRHGDWNLILEFYNPFKTLSDETFLTFCESANKTGIVGPHMQGLQLIALYKASLQRNIPSDISFEHNCLINFN